MTEEGQCGLRSIDDYDFNIPRSRINMAERSIAVVGPKWWNALLKGLTCALRE
ncbi:hypothetical protein DPMN_021316 [Dreissena polymorpha]|uniref:Uncharacterized protein n=1 Tax=Dreissena polymorpha TaxID=45954 RepID=A0A9D4NMM8_DREPO|nr:hypothetical protein DPMN_021316 [Dreissena polymorpha]